MTKRMLIDGTHPEEIRVVVTDGKRLDEYDVETSTKKQLKGNIYLAKVTRVEPSLQAAFVEYGGNRHGFLAFNEIHPDYYQIPVADREALLAEHEEMARQAEAAQAHVDEIDGGVDEDEDDDVDRDGDMEPEEDAADDDEAGEPAEAADEDAGTSAGTPEPAGQPGAAMAESTGAPADGTATQAIEGEAAPSADADDAGQSVDMADIGQPVGSGDAEPSADAIEAEQPIDPADAEQPIIDEAAMMVDPATAEQPAGGERRRRRPPRRYKIQEVIKRRQILLVQVVKEERGNKGAALTTFISLAGRYCVLMPNTARGGGISRKITNATSRRKLRKILGELEIPGGMGVIMRTAGMERNKSEIKRDLDYLLRAWDEVRELTLKSTAPTLVYEEASLIKRAIRDLYAKEIEEVLVDGGDAYQTAKKFMRLLMPSHAKRVQPYRDGNIPLFFRYQVEGQLDAMHSPVVQLRSGGYIVIHTTEALVAIDVNSGRSTRERNIEETALKTNLEAAEEIARQLRLRDLAGLIVIDFIDMEESRNMRAVERKVRESMKSDRARIQIGRISGFGLLELSRQRLRPSLIETSAATCPHCQGTGFLRSTESMAMRVLRAIEEEGIRNRSSEVAVTVSTPVAIYILNQKRGALVDIEGRYGFSVSIVADDTVMPPEMRLERGRAKSAESAARHAVSIEEVAEGVEALEDQAAEDDEKGAGEDETKRRPRRRRGRKKAAAEEAAAEEAATESAPAVETTADGDGEAGETDETGETAEASGDEERSAKRRRRGRRGGRRRSRRTEQTDDATAATAAAESGDAESAGDEGGDSEPIEHWSESTPVAASEPEPGPEPAPETASEPEFGSHGGTGPSTAPWRPVESGNGEGSNGEAVATDVASPSDTRVDAPEEPGGEPDSGALEAETTSDSADEAEPEADTIADMPPEVAADRPRRRGWWQKLME